MRFIGLLAACLAFATFACRRDTSPPQLATPSTSAPIRSAMPAPPVPPIARRADASTACLAHPRDSFHLRRTETDASVGLELPAGTALEPIDRTFTTRRTTALFHVRVVGTEREGFVFLARDDLDANCPFVWLARTPRETAAERIAGGLLDPGPHVDLARGFRRTLREALGRDTELGEGDDAVSIDVDIDRDGRADRIVSVDANTLKGIVLARHLGLGWIAMLLDETADETIGHTGSLRASVVEARDAAYAVVIHEDIDRMEEYQHQTSVTVFRALDDARVVAVLSADEWPGGRDEPRTTWRIEGDRASDGVRIVEEPSMRSERWVFDPATARMQRVGVPTP